MSDVIDVFYRLRDMVSSAANTLREQIADAQKVLDRLDAFADQAQDSAELIAASDLAPGWVANIPERSGLMRREERGASGG